MVQWILNVKNFCLNNCNVLDFMLQYYMKGGGFVKERLKELRKALGLSQQEFSERINVAQSTYAHFETGRRELRDIHISQICTTFNVREEWLRDGTGEMFNQLNPT